MSLRPMGLLACVVLLYLFHSPLFDMAYSIGLYPRPTATEIEQWLAAKGEVISADCEEDVAGWAFVCDVAYPSRRGPSGQKIPSRQKARHQQHLAVACSEHRRRFRLISPFRPGTTSTRHILPAEEAPPLRPMVVRSPAAWRR